MRSSKEALKYDKIKLSASGNLEVPAFLTLKEKGYRVWRDGTHPAEDWRAQKGELYFLADGPLQLLGLVAVYESRGSDWRASDSEIDEFMESFSGSAGVLLCFEEPGGSRRVWLEDDGRTGYAYLLDGEAIVGDVWLYNVGENPSASEWHDPSNAPFRNPAKFCSERRLPPLQLDSAVTIEWQEVVSVRVDGVLWAKLRSGEKPGWSRQAKIAGPVAKPLAAVGDT